MRKSLAGLISLALASGMVAATSSTSTAAPGAGTPAPARSTAGAADTGPASDELPNPLEDKRRELREAGLTAVLDGTATAEQRGRSKVVKVGTQPQKGAKATKGQPVPRVDQYAELNRTGTDKIFVVLAEFGNQRDPRFPDRDTDPTTAGPTTFEGPLHNNIPAPDQAMDNSTVWQPDYAPQHYQDLYFGQGKAVESLKTYYEAQSSGKYSVAGEVTSWVKVPYNEARYGRSGDKAGTDPNVCGSNVCDNTWALVRDAVNQWSADRTAAGASDAALKAELASFDVQDRYDFDGDGNFNEPDGYIDHFQIVHAGGDESDGDPQQGEDAIWAHRWYAYGTDAGLTGPSSNPLGGTQIGASGLWVGDYTMQPENGGLSVFAHEYGHDLGLPDHYDTAGGSNGVEFWNLMAQSRLSAKDEPLGTRPGDLSMWDKLQLGWMDYTQVRANQKKTLELGPHEIASKKPQGLVVSLPEKVVTTELGAPYAGAKQYFSGSGDDLANTAVYGPFDLTGTAVAQWAFKARWAIEQDYDYLYVQSSSDGGATWNALDGTVNGAPFQKDASGTPALSGEQPAWGDVVVPLAAGSKPLLRFLYRTDGGLALAGFFADDLVVRSGATTVYSDGAETTPTPAPVLSGFSVVGARSTASFPNYYLASHRSWTGYDRYLQTGPYNFGFASKPDFVEHFSYQQGLLVSYWDTSQQDNNTSVHPGQGLVLPVDAHPAALTRVDGKPWRSRVQVYDAPFGQAPVTGLDLHLADVSSPVAARRAEPVFDDSRSYHDPAIPASSVQVPSTGTRIEVVRQKGTSMTLRLS